MTKNNTLKVGDRVTVIPGQEYLGIALGVTYTVAEVTGIGTVRLEGSGGRTFWNMTRFTKVPDAEKKATYRVQEFPNRSEYVVERAYEDRELRRRIDPASVPPVAYRDPFRSLPPMYNFPRYIEEYVPVTRWAKVQSYYTRADAINEARRLSKPAPKVIATFFDDGSSVIA